MHASLKNHLVHGEVSGKPDQMRTSDLCSRHPFVGFVTTNALSLVSLHMLEMFIGHNGKSTDFIKKVAVISKIGVKNNILQDERRKKTMGFNAFMILTNKKERKSPSSID